MTVHNIICCTVWTLLVQDLRKNVEYMLYRSSNVAASQRIMQRSHKQSGSANFISFS